MFTLPPRLPGLFHPWVDAYTNALCPRLSAHLRSDLRCRRGGVPGARLTNAHWVQLRDFLPSHQPCIDPVREEPQLASAANARGPQLAAADRPVDCLRTAPGAICRLIDFQPTRPFAHDPPRVRWKIPDAVLRAAPGVLGFYTIRAAA